MSKIFNAAEVPLFARAGTTPDVSGALQDYYQPMVFERVTKMVEGFQVVETGDPINFRGVAQPLSGRQLAIKPEGQRAWNWIMLHSDIALGLKPDDCVIWKGKQTRVMVVKDEFLYGYFYYELVQDWTGSGPG